MKIIKFDFKHDSSLQKVHKLFIDVIFTLIYINFFY